METTINGKPSVFKTLDPPTPQRPTYPERVADFTGIAREMVNTENLSGRNSLRGSNLHEMAEVEAKQHTACPQCQADMIQWRLANPTATKLDAEDAHRDVWENCPTCQAVYCEHLDEVDRQAKREACSLETLEHEAYEAEKPRVNTLPITDSCYHYSGYTVKPKETNWDAPAVVAWKVMRQRKSDAEMAYRRNRAKARGQE